MLNNAVFPVLCMQIALLLPITNNQCSSYYIKLIKRTKPKVQSSPFCTTSMTLTLCSILFMLKYGPQKYIAQFGKLISKCEKKSRKKFAPVKGCYY